MSGGEDYGISMSPAAAPPPLPARMSTVGRTTISGMEDAWVPENIEIDQKIASLSASADQFRRMKTKMLRMREMHKVAAIWYTRYYYALMIPTLVLSMMLSTASALLLNQLVYKTFVTVVSAVNSLLLSLVAFLKLQSTMDQHKKAVDMYDNLFTEFEFEQELRFLDPDNDEEIKKTLMGKLEHAREKILKLKVDCPSIPAWVTTSMIPTSGGKRSAWEQVVDFEQGAQVKEIMKPVICKLKMQDKQAGVKNDEDRSNVYAALLIDASDAIANLHRSEEDAVEQRRAANNSIVAMLSNCKKLRERKMPEPLSDTEFDALMHQYAKLNGADATSLEQEITEFTKDVLKVRANATLSKLTDLGCTSQLTLLSNRDYDVLKKETRAHGKILLTKLGRMHGDPLLKSCVSDDVYNTLRTSKKTLDAPFEDEVLCTDPVLQALLEIEALAHAHHSGQKIVDDEDYDLKMSKALEKANSAVDDPRTSSHLKMKIGEKLRDISQCDSLPSEVTPLMMHLLASSHYVGSNVSRPASSTQKLSEAPAPTKAWESSGKVYSILPGSAQQPGPNPVGHGPREFGPREVV